MSVSFKKYLQLIDSRTELSEEQVNEIFGLFKNNAKIDKLRAEREKSKNMDPKKRAALDQALKDFAAGKKPGSIEARRAEAAGITDDDLESALGADDRKVLAKQDQYQAKNQTGKLAYT